MKRLFDVCVSFLALAVLWPALILIAICICVESSGGVFFRQERVGRWRQPFRIWKFRTMCVGASDGRLITVGDDARITRVGAFLRRTKLDEVPQFLNVLVGEMSVVGPRPEVSRYVDMYPEAIRGAILSVRPGIIDWASIRFRRESEILGSALDPEKTYIEEILPVKLSLGVDYARNGSFAEDLRILGSYLVLITGLGGEQSGNHPFER